MSRVSLGPPRSARFQDFSKIAWRVGRRLSEAKSGCWVVFCRGMSVTAQLALLRGLRGGGNFRIAQPGERVLLHGDVSRSLGSGEQLGSKAVVRVDSSSLSFFSFALSAAERLAPE